MLSDTYSRMPAEWELQSFVQIAWPHANSDWAPYLAEAIKCYIEIARAVSEHETLLIVSPEPETVKKHLTAAGLWPRTAEQHKIVVFACPTNDTWARDHAFISTLNAAGQPMVHDFGFNGWGMKFVADNDNQINERMWQAHKVAAEYADNRRIILEGGSIESDGQGTLLTTASCLLAPNRNYFSGKAEAEDMLCKTLNAKHILWLDHGYLAGDDTDGHIDTLARLCPNNTIAYVQCTDSDDEHFAELQLMEQELQQLRTPAGEPYRLLPLPMTAAINDQDDRLPATYANFLIINNAVLMPTYGQPAHDAQAAEVLATAFPDRQIIGIDCRTLIRQHGSLHCVTMQYPSEIKLIF